MMMPATAVFAMAAPPEGGSALVQFIPFVLVIGIFSIAQYWLMRDRDA